MKKKLIVEFIGTFFFIFTVGCAGVLQLAGTRGAMAPVAIGGILMVMVFAGGHISGGMYNPAVSLSAMLRGRLPAKDFVAYVIVQLVAAMLAGLFITRLIAPDYDVRPLDPDIRSAMICEFLFTFALCFVVLNVATSKGTQGNSFYGLAIGGTMMTGVFAVGEISGGVFNPAIGIGMVMMKYLSFKTVIFYVIVQFVAGGAAALAFKVANPESRPKSSPQPAAKQQQAAKKQTSTAKPQPEAKPPAGDKSQSSAKPKSQAGIKLPVRPKPDADADSK